MKESCTKQKIVEAAVFLFNTKGYNGTTVRDIAGKAKVNAANISYYFSGKQGLLEHLITDFLEGYIGILERAFEMQAILTPKEMLIMVVRDVLRYQSENRQLARFFYREFSLDSMLIREVMTTYFRRERYYLQEMIKKGERQGEFRRVPFSVFMTQLKGMLSAPYLYPQYISEVLHEFPSQTYFTSAYAKEVEKWLEGTLFHSQAALTPPRTLVSF
ncbi:MAG: forespore capture DNA-binding protein RefZ [Ectobacillus sp.]